MSQGTHTFVVEERQLDVPIWVRDLRSFRKWYHGKDVPENAPRICFLNGRVWVDMSKEQVFTQVAVKTEFGNGIGPLVKKEQRGRYFGDGVQITNVAAGLSDQPDGIFILGESFDSGAIRLVEGAHEGVIELEGTPDMVLEVVSTSSVKKDFEILPDLYWRAGISEYWLVDVRKDKLVFDIHRHTAEGYVPIRPRAGWLRSSVLEHAFRLSRSEDPWGHPLFTLEVR